MDYRIERDSMGEMQVPAGAYYGASTQRAVENFPISKLRFGRRFIWALGLIKWAAAKANKEMGRYEAEKADAVMQACDEVMDGKFDDEFVVDIFQTGSGTSTNMNANEVIANRATEILGGTLGSKLVHPNDHVNNGQSSNDVIPTAIHLAAAGALREDLLPALGKLAVSLDAKAEEFKDVVKTGRTHLMDATPVTLGQELGGWRAQVLQGVDRLNEAMLRLTELAQGGTAVGTGINAHPQFGGKVAELLSKRCGFEFTQAGSLFAGLSSQDAAVETSGQLKVLAVSLMKIANDLRWMNSGPLAGLGEIALPALQPGSSIMPGKVNPVMSESLLMECMRGQG